MSEDSMKKAMAKAAIATYVIQEFLLGRIPDLYETIRTVIGYIEGLEYDWVEVYARIWIQRAERF